MLVGLKTGIPKQGVLALTIAGFVVFAAPNVSEASEAERYGPEYQRCNDKPTLQIVTCVQEFTKAWDDRLNAAYKKLRGSFPEERKILLRDSQRLWVKYRDANCAYYYSREGSLRHIEAAECLRSMTAARALELEDELRP